MTLVVFYQVSGGLPTDDHSHPRFGVENPFLFDGFRLVLADENSHHRRVSQGTPSGVPEPPVPGEGFSPSLG